MRLQRSREVLRNWRAVRQRPVPARGVAQQTLYSPLRYARARHRESQFLNLLLSSEELSPFERHRLGALFGGYPPRHLRNVPRGACTPLCHGVLCARAERTAPAKRFDTVGKTLGRGLLSFLGARLRSLKRRQSHATNMCAFRHHSTARAAYCHRRIHHRISLACAISINFLAQTGCLNPLDRTLAAGLH